MTDSDEMVKLATSDSSDYRHTFYGILNAQGQFWTPLPFHSEEAAKAHLERHAIGDYRRMLRTHKIVPVRIQLTALRARARTLVSQYRGDKA